MAVVDADYRFIFVDVGSFGRQSDGGIFATSPFGQSLERCTLNIPPSSHLPNTDVNFPYVFIGDEAFSLRKDLMRPFPGRDLEPERIIFNYRLSRARRVVENAFGILSARWRLLRRPIEALPENVDKIVCASICLHNFCLEGGRNEYAPINFVDFDDEGELRPGDWRNGACSAMKDIRKGTSNRSSHSAAELRSTLKDYFVSDVGSVSWQNNVLKKGRKS